MLRVRSLVAKRKELLQVVGLEETLLARIDEDAIGEKLFEDLPLIDFLFDRRARHEAIDCDGAILADAPRSFARLCVSRRVPIRIEYHDAICRCEIETQAADTRCEQKNENIRLLKKKRINRNRGAR